MNIRNVRRKRLYKVYHDDNFNEEGDATIDVIGLPRSIFFRTTDRYPRYYEAYQDMKLIKIYSYEKDVKLSRADVKLSVWEYDSEKKHILLQKLVRKKYHQTNYKGFRYKEEDFIAFLDSIERFPDDVLERRRNFQSTQEDRVFFSKEESKIPHFKEWESEDIRAAHRLIYIKQGVLDDKPKEKIEEIKEERYSWKRILLGLFGLLTVGGGVSSLLLQNSLSSSAKVISTVTPTDSPLDTNLTTNNPTFKPTMLNPVTETPTEQPTNLSKQPTQTPTERQSMTPSFHPTEQPIHLSEQPTQTPTEGPATVSKTPSQAPTESLSFQPTQTPTEQSTQIPTESPSIQPTLSPTISPSQIPTESPSIQPTPSPSISLTQKPSTSPTTVAPTLLPTSSPILSPTRSPFLQKTSRLSCEEIRKSEGATEGNFGKNNFKVETKEGNKYCGDTYGGKDPERPNRNKWSVRSGRKDCPIFSYEEGFNICDSVGARWCSLEELELLVGKGTGCGGDEELIYTNTDCDLDSGLIGKVKYAPGSQAGKFPNFKCEVDLYTKSLVRCCGDVY